MEWPLRIEDSTLVLEFYGDGADGASSYVREYLPTSARMTCLPRVGSSLTELIEGSAVQFPEAGLALEQFVGCEQGKWYVVEPPWNSVLLYPQAGHEGGVPLVFRIDDVEFFVERYMAPSSSKLPPAMRSVASKLAPLPRAVSGAI